MGRALGSDGSLAVPIDHWFRAFQGISIRSEETKQWIPEGKNLRGSALQLLQPGR